MSKSSDLKMGSGADVRRKLNNSAHAADRVTFALPGAVPDEEYSPAVCPAVRQSNIMSTSPHGLVRLVTSSCVRDAQPRLTTSAPDHMRFVLPGTVDDEEWIPAAVRQSNIMSTSAHGHVTSSGVRVAQRKLTASAPAADRVMRFVLPGAVEDKEWIPAAVRQSNIMSASAQGVVTSSSVRYAQRRLNISTHAVDQESIAPPGALQDEERSQTAVRQNNIMSTSAQGLVTSSGGRDAQRRLNVSTPAAVQESIAPLGALQDERRQTEQKTTRRKKKSIRAFLRRTWRAIKKACCICQNEDNVEQFDPSDPQADPSGLPSSAREDQADLQKGPSGPKQTGFQEPAYCQSGLMTLEKTAFQEAADPKNGPFDHERSAPGDQADYQSGPSGLRSSAREKNRQNSPSGLEPAGFKKPAYCQSGLSTFEITAFQEAADPKNGPFDHERSAPGDQADYQSGPSGLRSSAREKNRQNSPSGLEPAGFKKPAYCQSGLSTFEITAFQEAADPKNGLFDQEQSDQSDYHSSLSSLQSSDSDREVVYEVGKLIEKGAFDEVYEGTRKPDGKKVAIKFIKKLGDMDMFAEIPGHPKPLYLEVAANLLLRKPEKSPHVVEMLDWFEEEDQIILILDFPHPCITLLNFLKKNRGCLSEIQARDIMRQAVVAHKHCFDHGVHHYNFSLDNFLVNTETMQLKLIDFGLCAVLPSCDHGGTEDSDKQREAVADAVFFLAILLFELLHGPGSMAGFDAVYTATMSNECRDMLDLCLERKPGISATLEDLLDHPWFHEE